MQVIKLIQLTDLINKKITDINFIMTQEIYNLRKEVDSADIVTYDEYAIEYLDKIDSELAQFQDKVLSKLTKNPLIKY
jgi:hypothetical protein